MGAGIGHLRELLLYGCPDSLAVGVGGGDAAVVVLDGCLYGIDTLGALGALILDLLLEHSHRSWGVGELVDAIGSRVVVAEGLETLQVAGLIERTDAFVCIAPTSRKK